MATLVSGRAARPVKSIVLVNVIGEDRPGVTSTVAEVLARHGALILDIGQAVIHDTLNLGILAAVEEGRVCAAALEEVLSEVHRLGLQARIQPVAPERYQHWVEQQGRPRHIVTLLAPRIAAEHIARVAAVAAEGGLTIDTISRLSGRIPLDRIDRRSKACVEFSVRGAPLDAAAFRARLLELAAELGVDLACQEDDIFRRHRRLVAFDMDSTLIEQEVIDELAREAGKGEEVARITEAAMRGELDFRESFARRLALLAGLPEAALEVVARRLRLTEGAEKLLATLRRLGYKTAILSGGFDYFGREIQRRLGIDYLYANHLDIAGGRLTGRVVGEVVDGPRKAELLQKLAEREGIRLEQTVAVGDGANDLPMLSIAGLGIAFRAKPLVRASAKQAISTIGLDGVLYLMGIRDRDADGELVTPR
ncbi:MAG: phosphoserine phosphatase SerB [Porticoccaceae bacterium]|nr:MAG: phosphoserine phosphatase SerB [Porticoccaceae bacterium]